MKHQGLPFDQPSASRATGIASASPSFFILRSPLALLATVALLIVGTLAAMALAFPAPPQHVLDAPEPIAYRATQ